MIGKLFKFGELSLNKGLKFLFVWVLSLSLNAQNNTIHGIITDASATTIYGSRGSNGIVLVTTMGGQEGKMQITFDAQVGASTMVNRFDFLNTYDYALALNDILGANTVSAADLETYKNGTKGVNWVDLMMRTGISQDYKLSVSGGNKSPISKGGTTCRTRQKPSIPALYESSLFPITRVDLGSTR